MFLFLFFYLLNNHIFNSPLNSWKTRVPCWLYTRVCVCVSVSQHQKVIASIKGVKQSLSWGLRAPPLPISSEQHSKKGDKGWSFSFSAREKTLSFCDIGHKVNGWLASLSFSPLRLELHWNGAVRDEWRPSGEKSCERACSDLFCLFVCLFTVCPKIFSSQHKLVKVTGVFFFLHKKQIQILVHSHLMRQVFFFHYFPVVNLGIACSCKCNW